MRARTTKKMATHRHEHFLAKDGFWSLFEKRAFLSVAFWPGPRVVTAPPPPPMALRPWRGWWLAVMVPAGAPVVALRKVCTDVKLLRTGRNGVSDEVYCSVLLLMQRDF